MTRASDRFDTAQPHPARVYDYLLGGKDNFAADREFGERMVVAYPEARDAAWENRAFMRRVVAWIARETGVRQFLDIGTGLPTSPNLHEVVQQIAPESRVVYVDNDPIVLTHARALLTSSPEGATAYVDADIRDPEKILTSAAEVLDLSQPVAVTTIALLHYVPDGDDPIGIVARLMTALPAGSYLAISHGTHDPLTPDRRMRMEQLWAASPVPSQVRSRPEVERFFAGLDLVDPGVVPITHWRPDDETDQQSFADIAFYGGLAVKP
jgi:S-adenosyl methyltransferase